MSEAPIQPLDVSGVRTVAVGTALWALVTVAALLNLDSLRDHDRMWWLWTCFAGLGLGAFGVTYCLRRERHLHPHGHRPAAAPPTVAP